MDPQLAATENASYSEAMPPRADVDDFLRKKRKIREHKACYPCRQRKVKCDLSRPCRTCCDRDHPELCSYHPPNSRQSVEQSSPGPALRPSNGAVYGLPFPSPDFVTLRRTEFDLLCRKLDGLENSISDLRRELRRSHYGNQSEIRHGDSAPGREPEMHAHSDIHGLLTRNEPGEMVHLGGGPISSMLYALNPGQASGEAEQVPLQELLGKSVLPLFGLDSESAAYPFVDLWGLPHGSLQRARELANALPGDNQMLSLFRSYQSMAHVNYPAIADLDQLERDLVAFLAARQTFENPENVVTEQMIYGQSFYWLGMLFGVLASGAQCSALARKERELTSKVYICCAFECLRFTNFLSQPRTESIQALLLIGGVMINNLNAGNAWSLLGLTVRLAQGLGLHQACPPHISADVVFTRSKVWWAVVWQDSILSITCDRSASLDVCTMPMPQHFGSVNPYHLSMYRISKVVLEIVRDRARVQSSRELVTRINQHREEIASVMREATSDHLRDSRLCQTDQETMEHWTLYLHTSYALSELCRPAISPRMSNEAMKPFQSVCIENLVNVVEAFLGLSNMAFFARQCWAAIHSCLSSALLLAILGEHTRDERTRKLIRRFIVLTSDMTSSVDDPIELSTPVQRGIDALKRINMEEGPDKAQPTEFLPLTALTALPPHLAGSDCEDSATSTTANHTHTSTTTAANLAASVAADSLLKIDSHQPTFPTATLENRATTGIATATTGTTTTTTTAAAAAAAIATTAFGHEGEHSPYSVLNHILWGTHQGPLQPDLPPF